MKKKKVRKVRFTKGEKMLYITAFLCLISTMVLKIFCGASVGHLSMNVEKLKYDISEQEKKIESLNMQVNELTSFTEVQDVVKNMGLSYNNQNVIIINE